ncbi:hypothetical protein [Daejeonella sp. H1SJ63]|uniref:hypothetical protein n=1 Tax=Daejeonella sp. H1SJ63 TaxID=3034145 RepID=UPI0023ECEE71|nr:hypothetical protein [Daejeonella sp. H1SJ63]
MQNSNLIEIDKLEAMSINGGNIVPWSAAMRATWWGALIFYAMENYEDLKGGAVSAYHDYYKK